MVLLKMMAIVGSLVVMVDAQPRCDPLTQYEDNGQCCKMCGPGTSMSSLGTCLEPQCHACYDKEYQDKYTRQPKCTRQPYCDPNLNFEVPVYEPTIKTTCMCKEGFHCSSPTCINCVPHTNCEQGYGAQTIGNHSHDTVCQKCGKGTFSNETSWSGVCKNWTKCGVREYPKQSGTDVSDMICGNRLHDVAIGLCAVGALLVLVLVMWLCRGRCQGQAKDCFESCLKDKTEPLTVVTVPDTHPVDSMDEEEQVMLPEMQSTQEEGHQTPVENEDVLFSEQGNVVTQENGKAEQLSRQESQTTTFTDSMDTKM